MRKIALTTMVVLGIIFVNLSFSVSYASSRRINPDSLKTPYIKTSDKKGEFHTRRDGSPLYKARFRKVGDFHEGVAWVQNQDKKFFHIDSTGNAIYKQKYVKVYDFVNGYAIAENDIGCFHIKKNGVPLYSRKFLEVRNFSEGLAAVENEDNDCFFIDSTGTPQGKKKYLSVKDFTQGYAWVQDIDDGKFYLINKLGTPVLSDRYISILTKNGQCIAKDDSSTFIITIKEDKTVEIVIKK